MINCILEQLQFGYHIRSSLKHTNSTCSGHGRPNVFQRRKAHALFIDRRCISYNEHNEPKITNRVKLWGNLVKQTNDTNISHDSINRSMSSPTNRSRNFSDDDAIAPNEIFSIARFSKILPFPFLIDASMLIFLCNAFVKK